MVLISIPVTTAIIILSLGRKIGIRGTKLITIINIIILNVAYVITKNKEQTCGNWINIGTIEEISKIRINNTMTSLIIIISSCVIIYSYNYLNKEPHIIRYIGYLEIFIGGMLLLVNSRSIITIYIGWEIIGITSMKLINYWNSNRNSNKSSIKALLYNKIGDIGLLISILIIYNKYTNTNNTIEIGSRILTISIITAIIGKSAQLIFIPWLGDAMAAPTPVSALLHAATMVTAGIYLYTYLQPIIDVNNIPILYEYIGIGTIIITGISALTTNDIKRIIAYSTASQLGYMLIGNIIRIPELSRYHLYTHGYYKALIFITAGIIIHNSWLGEQDIRRYGQIRSNRNTIIIGIISLMAYPYLSGWYSKEQIIISTAYNKNTLYYGLIIGNILTCLYTYRLYKMTYNSYTNNRPIPTTGKNKGILTILMTGSIIVGYMIREIYTNKEILIYDNINRNNSTIYENLIIIIPIITITIYRIGITKKIIQIYNRRVYIDQLINNMTDWVIKKGYQTTKEIEQGIIENTIINMIRTIYINPTKNTIRTYQIIYMVTIIIIITM